MRYDGGSPELPTCLMVELPVSSPLEKQEARLVAPSRLLLKGSEAWGRLSPAAEAR